MCGDIHLPVLREATVQRVLWNVAALLVLLAAISSPSHAGPPFITDDPEPVDLGHWEIYGFTAATHVRGDSGGALAGVEVNYGAAPNLQLHVIALLAFVEIALATDPASQARPSDILRRAIIRTATMS